MFSALYPERGSQLEYYLHNVEKCMSSITFKSFKEEWVSRRENPQTAQKWLDFFGSPSKYFWSEWIQSNVILQARCIVDVASTSPHCMIA